MSKFWPLLAEVMHPLNRHTEEKTYSRGKLHKYKTMQETSLDNIVRAAKLMIYNLHQLRNVFLIWRQVED